MGGAGDCGISRRRFLPALVKARNAYLAAVGSRSLEHAAASVAIAGEGRAVGSYAEALDDPSVDIVYIPLPNALHREWVLASLAAGKHVLCEKPLVQDEPALRQRGRASGGCQASRRCPLGDRLLLPRRPHVAAR